MKKITLALFFVAAAFSLRAQCPDQAQMVMIAEDTNTVFHVGQGNTNTVPASMPCNSAMAFMIYPQLWGPGSASIYQPCIRTRYNLYYTTWRNNVEERFYQNGSYIYNLDITNAPVRRIGGTAPPGNGAALWDFSLYQISALASHSVSVCNRVGGALNTDSVSIRDCWRNVPGPYASNPAFATASPCLTWNDPASSGNIGSVAWSISPVVGWPAFAGYSNGTAYVDPKYLPPATYTVTYNFTPPAAGTPACATVTKTYVFTITNPYTATWGPASSLCSNGACVNLTTSGSGGGTWSGTGVSGSQFCPSISGAGTFPVTYSVGVSAACGASVTNSFTVTPTPTLSISGQTSICSGQSSVLTGTLATTYTWMPGNVNTSTISVSPTGATTYTLTGANGNCTAVQTVAMIVAPTPTLNVAGANICSGQSVVLTNTGTASGSYTWSPSGGSAGSATVSPTTNTTYTISGANGACTGTTTATVNVTATPTLSATGGSVCAGGSVVLTSTVTGTTTGYTWTPSGGNASTATVTPGGTQTYTLTADNSGCSTSATAVVNVTPNPTVTITPANGNTICSGTSTTLTAGGATNYTWSPNAGGGGSGTVVVSPTTTDTYTLTGETSGCPSTQVITINVTATPTLSPTASAPTICVGQTTTLTATGAPSYTWMPGGSTANPLPVTPGSTQIYTVTGDNAGCTATQTVAVNVNPLPTIVVGAAPSSLCTGQTTTITASGANTYTWSPNASAGNVPSFTITPGATDTYTVTATDNNGCVNSNTVTVAVGAGAVIGIATTSNTVCAGQPITLNGSGATNYTWSPGGQTTGTITVTPPTGSTSYTLTGDNGGGCTGTQTITVNSIPNPTVTTAATSTAICSGGSTTINGGGATNYTWMPGGSTTPSITVTPGANTTYTLTGETNGCTNVSTIAVNVTTTPTVTANASAGTICAGQSTVLTGGGAGTFTWMPGGSTVGTITVTPGANTTYTLTGANGTCTATATAVVNVTPLPNVTAVSDIPAICNGQGSPVLTASGASTYTWSANAGGVNTNTVSVNPTSTTTYTVTGTTNGCDNVAQVSVTVNPTPTLVISATSGTICAGGSTTLNGNGATTYTWMPGGLTSASPAVTPTISTTYTVTGDNGGCTATATVAVVVNPTPTLGNNPSIDSALCGMPTGGVTNINVTGGTPGYTYQWYNGSTPITGATADSLTNVGIGTYSVQVTDANGCIANGGIAIFTIPGSGAVTAGITPPLSTGQAPLTVVFGNTSTGATAYGWNFGNGTSSTAQFPTGATYTAPGTYIATLIASNGSCWDTASAVIIIDQPTVIVIPNIFSPNADGVNDVFFIFNTGLSTLNCDIFNRWGQHMSTLNAPQAVWDGKTPNGQDASEGTYYYILKAVGIDGKTYDRQGPVTLVK